MLISLRARLAFVFALLLTVILGALLYLITDRARIAATDLALEQARILSQKNTREIEGLLERALLVARAQAHFALTERLYAQHADSRKALFAYLPKELQNQPDFFGAWYIFAPNAFDGRDAKFAGKPGHDKYGRISYYWTLRNGQVRPQIYGTQSDVTEEYGKDYYKRAFESGKPVVTEPYFDDFLGDQTEVPVLMTSMAYPIKEEGGKPIGVSGIDISLESLQKMVESIKPYGTGRALVVASSGTVVGAPNREWVGKTLQEMKFAPDLIWAVETGATYTKNRDLIWPGLRAAEVMLQPVRIDGIDTKWSFVIAIPHAEIFAPVYNEMIKTLKLGILFIIIGALFVWGVSDRLAAPTERAARELKQRAKEVRRREREHAAQDFETFVKSGISDITKAADEFAQVFRGLRESLVFTSSSTRRTADQTQVLSGRLSEVSAVYNNLRDMVQGIASETTQASALTQEAGTKASEAADMVARLTEVSERIGGIVQMIESIASKTNLLALNASIEAARAGEAGKGFAVVAGEVKNLAAQTAQATANISKQIAEVQEITAISAGRIRVVAENTEQVARVVGQVSGAVGRQRAVGRDVQSVIADITTDLMEMRDLSTESSSRTEKSERVVQSVTATVANLQHKLVQLEDRVEIFLKGLRG